MFMLKKVNKETFEIVATLLLYFNIINYELGSLIYYLKTQGEDER